MANSAGLSHDVSPHFALFKDEGFNFGKGTLCCSEVLFLNVCWSVFLFFFCLQVDYSKCVSMKFV